MKAPSELDSGSFEGGCTPHMVLFVGLVLSRHPFLRLVGVVAFRRVVVLVVLASLRWLRCGNAARVVCLVCISWTALSVLLPVLMAAGWVTAPPPVSVEHVWLSYWV